MLQRRRCVAFQLCHVHNTFDCVVHLTEPESNTACASLVTVLHSIL